MCFPTRGEVLHNPRMSQLKIHSPYHYQDGRHLAKHPYLQAINLAKLPHLQPRAGSVTLAAAAVGSVAAVASTVKHSMPVAKPVLGLSAQGSKHTSAVYAAYTQFAAGAIGGGTATYSTHWLDTIKVKMQTSPNAYPSGFYCLKQIIKEEGVKGLYQGATPAMVGHTCKAAIVFTCFGVCEEVVKNLFNCQGGAQMPVCHHATAGAMTGVLASLVLCPVELVKCRMQATTTAAAAAAAPTRVGALGIVRHVVAQEGVSGLYRGITGMWAKEIPGSFVYFGSYETAKSLVRSFNQDSNRKLNQKEVFMCGVGAGLCFCIMHPIESAKTRVQVMPESKGFCRGLCQILRNEGVLALFSGLKPQMLRSSMYSGIQFVAYEAVKEYFLRDTDRDK